MEVASSMDFPSQKREFGCSSWMCDSFTVACNLPMLCVLLVLGLKFLKLGIYCKQVHRFFDMFRRRKSIDLRNGYCSSEDTGDVSGPKLSSFGVDFCDSEKESIENSERDEDDFSIETNDLGGCHKENGALVDCRSGNLSGYLKERESSEEDKETLEKVGEGCQGHEEDDVARLKNMLRIERERRNTVDLELEKERLAAASAANEAMVMIQRLQNEKNLIEMEARQYRSMAEQKQLYDREVIQALQWIVSKHEVERSFLENRLKQCQRRLFEGSTCNENTKVTDEYHDGRYQLKGSENAKVTDEYHDDRYQLKGSVTDQLEEDDCTSNQFFTAKDDCEDWLISPLDIDS